MAATASGLRARPTLRERKKARTLASVQHHALRLFRERGYEATTVEQICEAAEVSPSTFYRCFSTKEDVVLTNEYEPLIVAAFAAQPSELSPVAALREALRTVFAGMPEADLVDIRERSRLMAVVPELRAAFLGSMAEMMRQLDDVVAARVGRSRDAMEVRVVSGALMGAMTAVLLHWADHPDEDVLALVDSALGHLDAGLRVAADAELPAATG